MSNSPPGIPGFNSTSGFYPESNWAALENLLAETTVKISELDKIFKRLEIELNKAETSLYVPSEKDSKPTWQAAIAVNQTALSLNQSNKLQILPAGHPASSLLTSHQSKVEFLERENETSASNPSLIADLSGLPLSGSNHASGECLPNTAFKSWSCVDRSVMMPEEPKEGGIEGDDDDDYEPQAFEGKSDEPANDHYAMGYRGVSCVVGGNIVKTFDDESSGSGKLKLIATIPGLSTLDGKRPLFPSKIMLHRQDSSMIIQDKYNPNSLYNFDMQSGKVVDEWKISPDRLVDFCPGKKFNQMLPEATFVGASSNSLYTIDPRLSGCKGVVTKPYKTRTRFTCVVTTEYGWAAVGSLNGDIRLYDSLGKNAKTHLRAYQGPVLALDVSKDGAYLVATYEKYLVLFDSQMGFSRSIANSVNGCGTMVNLSPEHRGQLRIEGVALAYKPAKFNLGPVATERVIVSSIGPYLIAFDLQSILAGQAEYTIKRYKEKVVADNFRWNNLKDIIVTTPSDVFVQKREKLSRPQRHSL